MNYLLIAKRILNNLLREPPPPRRPWGLLAMLVPVATGLIIYRKQHQRPVKTFETESEDEQANDFMPVQSASERAAGHPIVGAS